ncbi:MAG: homocysteine S-methyltransferase family protein [Desulfovibrionaceae bacterium]|nr:homocysteine S-methyltransferase family protein [Desulfovibrionaceae bacterium]
MEDFATCFARSPLLLMEGALGERLKREFRIAFDRDVAMAGLVYEDRGRRALRRLWGEYAGIAEKYALPFMATTPTRRANRERVARSRFGDAIIEDNVRLLRSVAASAHIPMYVGGLMGCRGDAYAATEVLSAPEAERFHAWQAEAFRRAGTDFLFAGIMPALPEIIGMARAMAETGLSYIISFMILEYGKLPDGTGIHDAIACTDDAVERPPLCYMTNCVHPDVVCRALACECNRTETVRRRFRGIQANTSSLPPEALDASAVLHGADSAALAEAIARLSAFMQCKIVGGCCGTDGTHMEAAAERLCGGERGAEMRR